MLIDTHCHLDLPPLLEQLDLLLDEARTAGVTQWIVPSVAPGNWQRIADLGVRYQALRPAFGIHPLQIAEVQPEHLQQLDRIAPQGVAIGEIGLDAGSGNLEQQTVLFREQLRIARRHRLPVLIHCRHAIGRTIALLREEGAAEFGGIMHAFSGSVESARECIKLGFAIAISGTVTRPDTVRPVRLARELSLRDLVIETDAPDLTPASHQPAPNRPAWLIDVATALAEIRGCTLREIAEETSSTAYRVIPGLRNRP
jgi:TatD DNase family protein